MKFPMFHAGVARADITPSSGIRLTGYTVREGFCRGVDEPLTATVLALRGANSMVAWIALDSCIIHMRYATLLRARCALALGMPVANVLLNVSHTHAAPTPPDFMPYDSAEQLDLVAAYAEEMTRRIEHSCREAVSHLRPVRLATGWGECRANVNRRQRMPDGTVLLGEQPDGFNDPSIGVLRFDNPDGTPFAVAFRYSCHPVTFGPRTNVASPDFPGPARAVIERALSCPSLFLQGCGGNLNPTSGIGSDSDGREESERLGHMLGGEVLAICARLRTHRRRAAPRLVQSVAVYWLYEYEDITPEGDGVIHLAEQWLELPLVSFPPLPEVQRERAHWAKHLDDTLARGAGEADLLVARRLDYWSQVRLDAATRGPNPARIRFPIQVIVIGDVAVLAAPFELMAETGSALRKVSPFPHTFVLGYSNGLVTYLPTPEVSREGGMESKEAYRGDLLPAEIPGDWEPVIHAAFLDMLAPFAQNGK